MDEGESGGSLCACACAFRVCVWVWGRAYVCRVFWGVRRGVA